MPAPPDASATKEAPGQASTAVTPPAAPEAAPAPESIQMTPVAYGYDTGDPRWAHDDRYKVSLKFRNSSSKDISAFKGELTFKDAFGEKIKSVNVEVQDSIPAGSDLVWDGELDLNQFIARDIKLKDTPTDKLSLEWVTGPILFAGETKKDAAPSISSGKDGRARELAKLIPMIPVSYGLNEGDPRWTHDDRYQLALKFSNRADKDISAVKGVIIFSDAFGKTIKRVNLEVQDTIALNSDFVWEGNLKLNQFMDEDNKLVSTPNDKLTIEWLPGTILFTDGTRTAAQ